MQIKYRTETISQIVTVAKFIIQFVFLLSGTIIFAYKLVTFLCIQDVHDMYQAVTVLY